MPFLFRFGVFLMETCQMLNIHQTLMEHFGGDESSHYLRLPVGTRSENARVRAGNQNTLDTFRNPGKLYYRFNDKPDIVGYND